MICDCGHGQREHRDGDGRCGAMIAFHATGCRAVRIRCKCKEFTPRLNAQGFTERENPEQGRQSLTRMHD